MRNKRGRHNVSSVRPSLIEFNGLLYDGIAMASTFLFIVIVFRWLVGTDIMGMISWKRCNYQYLLSAGLRQGVSEIIDSKIKLNEAAYGNFGSAFMINITQGTV
jgi:hypothetical protein